MVFFGPLSRFCCCCCCCVCCCFFFLLEDLSSLFLSVRLLVDEPLLLDNASPRFLFFVLRRCFLDWVSDSCDSDVSPLVLLVSIEVAVLFRLCAQEGFSSELSALRGDSSSLGSGGGASDGGGANAASSGEDSSCAARVVGEEGPRSGVLSLAAIVLFAKTIYQ